MTLKRTLFALMAAMTLLFAASTSSAATQNAVRVEIDTAQYPDAMCNDGTPASYYLRGAGANGAISGTKWLVFLHGGGSCTSDDSCAERWYDRDASPDGNIGFHGNMTTSTGATKDFNGEGILDFDGVDGTPSPGTNPFSDFNRIMVPYCSSDTWAGRNIDARAVNYLPYVGTSVTIEGQQFPITNPNNVIPPLTSIRFSGAFIAEAVVDLVMNGGVATGRRVDGPGAAPAPLSSSDEIVISGSSAGGVGVIRNLDRILTQVRSYGSSAQVLGIIDAASGVGLVPDAVLSGDAQYATAQFYGTTGTLETDASCQVDHPIASSTLCYNTAVVERDYLETPHFVVQQSYDGSIHSALKLAIEQPLTPVIGQTRAALVATQYIRNRTSVTAFDLGAGVANPQHTGYYIPNYETPKHQLMVEDVWFFNTPATVASFGGNDPRLGADATSTLGLPRALSCFRFRVTGQGSGCVANGDAKVVNSTYPANPLMATYEPQTGRLTLPVVRLSNNALFLNVVIALDSLGGVTVGDAAVGGIGSLNAYNLATNTLDLPFVSLPGETYVQVRLTRPTFRVLSYDSVGP